MNAAHPEVRDNAARCVGLMAEGGLVESNLELLDTLLFLASSPLVEDRTGAASALSRTRGRESWDHPAVANALERLRADASYLVRQAAQPSGGA